MNPFKKETAWQKVSKPLTGSRGAHVVRRGLTAGAGLVAVSVASALTSAARRREEQR